MATAAAAPRNLSIDVTLNKQELELLAAKLKEALDSASLRSFRSQSATSGAAAPLQSGAPQHQQQQRQHQRENDQKQPDRPSQPQVPQPAQIAPAPPNAGAWSSPAQPQTAQHQWDVPPELRAGGNGSSGDTPVSSAWAVTWATETADHDGKDIPSIAYAPSLPGLPGGEGHGGWLISCSERMLNLWECSAATCARDDPGLMLMHSQMTDHATIEEIVAEAAGARLLVSTVTTQKPISQNGAPAPVIAMHSLSPTDAGFLAPLPSSSLAPQRTDGGAPYKRCPHAVSLHIWGGPLTATCAAAFDDMVVVMPMTKTLGRPIPVKAQWKAHSGGVSALHRSSFSIQLYTGGGDGKAHTWDMKGKPSKPVQSFNHSSRVVAIAQVSDYLLAAADSQGKISLWDLRLGSALLRSYTAPAGSVLAMTASGLSNSLVACTKAGAFHINPREENSILEKMPGGPSNAAPSACAWNSRTDGYYVAWNDGSISCLNRRH